MSKRFGHQRLVWQPVSEGLFVNTSRGRMYIDAVLSGYLPTSRLTDLRTEFAISSDAMEAQTGIPATFFLMLESEAATMSARELLEAMRCYRRIFIALAEGEEPTPPEVSEREWLRRFFSGLGRRTKAGENRAEIFIQAVRRWIESRGAAGE